MAGDGTLALMSRHLRRLGHRTYRSTMHANVGCTQKARDTLEAAHRGDRREAGPQGHHRRAQPRRPARARDRRRAGPTSSTASSRSAARMLAPGAAHSLLLFDLGLIVRLQQAGLGRMMGSDCTSGDCAQESWEQSRAPLHRDVAFTSVFSRRDGIIDWRACLDPLAKTVEVRTSHLGMAFDPVVLDIVGKTLAANRARQARSAAARSSARRPPWRQFPTRRWVSPPAGARSPPPRAPRRPAASAAAQRRARSACPTRASPRSARP